MYDSDEELIPEYADFGGSLRSWRLFYPAHPDESFEITVDGHKMALRAHDIRTKLTLLVADVPEVTGTCLVTQIEGPNIGIEAILSIWKQLANSLGKRNFAADIGYGSRRELWALKSSNDAGITCVPRLLPAKRFVQSQADSYLGGHLWYLLMEKVPGKDIRGFEEKSPEEKNEIQRPRDSGLSIVFNMARRDESYPDDSNVIYDLMCYELVSPSDPTFEQAKSIEIDRLDKESSDRGIKKLKRLMEEATAISRGDFAEESFSGTL
ncbi:hypothetical protein KEM56_007287 [Ascosphaera pollenicola]|nr:hypothetical protein KEM56_007287 [Ascosphaera pollenicola]